MKQTVKFYIVTIIIILFSQANLFALWDNGHKNTSSDAITYMETEGTNQQRWVVDYLKAKSGGRNSGSTFGNYEGDGHTEGNETGFVGIARAGAIAPDYTHDLFWDSDTVGWGWSAFGANYSSWTHFMNFNKRSAESNKQVVTNIYNDFDGWSYQANCGFDETGSLDYTIAWGVNDAVMTVNLPYCTDCSGKFTFVPYGNPAIDYKQNGSTTPVGNSAGGSKQLGTNNGTNYNCFSDNGDPAGSCPDRGTEVGGTYQIPNTFPGGDWDWTGSQDWVIFEPSDNAATFYFNEWWLEGGTSSGGSDGSDFDNSLRHSLQTEAITGRYYTITHSDVNFLSTAMHYAGDVNAQVHIHSTTGYNHSSYEEWIDNNYSSEGLKNFNTVKGYILSRSNQYDSDVDKILTENGYITYLARYRANYDILYNTGTSVIKNAAILAVNHTIATTVIMYEKGVLDLRKYRQ